MLGDNLMSKPCLKNSLVAFSRTYGLHLSVYMHDWESMHRERKSREQ